jgi:glycosyltransferase involved in cell wall biosynthesis
MKKQILITACSMDIGGIERSLAGLLSAFDYDKYDVDLLLFSKKGEFLSLVPPQCNVLPEIPQLATLLKPISDVALSGRALLAAARLISKLKINIPPFKNSKEQQDSGAALLQAYWDNSISLLPKLQKEYDAVLSFMWPHHYALKKVKAKNKIAWVHTDFTELAIDNNRDESIWKGFDKIAAVSDECGKAFSDVYPSLSNKVVTTENILTADWVRKQAEEFIPLDMPEDGGCRILSIGRFCYAKAFDFAAEICRRLIDGNVNVKWYIIGFGSDEALIKEKIEELSLKDNFIILGKKSNPYPYIKACDIYVQPSRYEGKAVTVREAQMLGKPVLITRFRTAASQVKEGFDAIISPMSAEAVAHDITELINNSALRKTLSDNSLASDYCNNGQITKIYEMIDSKGNKI